MFSRIQLLADAQTLMRRFGVGSIRAQNFFPKIEISGFEHAEHPVIIKRNIVCCEFFRWGLVPPDWKKAPETIWNHTISAKLEYIPKRYAWQKVAQNRCLIPATAYFEYRWNDAKGNSKTKYLIKRNDEAIFSLAGLYSQWAGKDGSILKTFAVCTTQANEVMQFVHNKDAAKNYHRMPVMLNPQDELSWLDPSVNHLDFAYPGYKPDLVADPVMSQGQMQLF